MIHCCLIKLVNYKFNVDYTFIILFSLCPSLCFAKQIINICMNIHRKIIADYAIIYTEKNKMIKAFNLPFM